MRKFANFLMVITALALFAACNPEGNGNGDGEKELPVNSYSLSGTPTQLKSVAVDMLGENIYIVASPTANLATAEEIFESEEYIFVAVSPILVGKEFDLKTESSLYTIMSTLGGAPLKEVTPENNSEVKAGTAKFTYEGGVAVAKATITLTNGKEFKLHLSAEKEVVVNENTIARGSEKKPLRAAFYDEGDYSTTLYFTPAGLEYFDELKNASWYIYLGVSNRLIDGKAHSLADMDGTSSFEFGIIDNINNMKSVEIMAGYLRGATGEFTIAKTGAATYTANINITLLGVQYVVSFNGECVSVLDKPEIKTNYFTYKGTEYKISDAALANGSSVWFVYLDNSSNEPIVLCAPESFFTSGGIFGFSQSADFTVSYGDRTYSKANGDNGTLEVSFDASNNEMSLHFFNNADIEFRFDGVAKLIK